jgi:hypothetical protein
MIAFPLCESLGSVCILPPLKRTPKPTFRLVETECPCARRIGVRTTSEQSAHHCALLKTMSLRAGSLPGTKVCATSTAVERSSPQSTTIHVEREFHPTAKPSGTNKQRFRIPSERHRQYSVADLRR